MPQPRMTGRRDIGEALVHDSIERDDHNGGMGHGPGCSNAKPKGDEKMMTAGPAATVGRTPTRPRGRGKGGRGRGEGATRKAIELANHIIRRSSCFLQWQASTEFITDRRARYGVD